jgi:hypothetical protein
MSYDFHLFRVLPHSNPIDAYKQAFAKRQFNDAQDGRGWRAERINLSKAVPTNERIVTALVCQLPSLTLYEHDYASLAELESICLREASHYKDLELTDSNLGLQITLFDNTAAIAIPFWPLEEERARNALSAAWICLRVLESEGGFSTYDPQVGRVLNLDSDFEAIVQVYRGMLNTVNRKLRTPQGP